MKQKKPTKDQIQRRVEWKKAVEDWLVEQGARPVSREDGYRIGHHFVIATIAGALEFTVYGGDHESPWVAAMFPHAGLAAAELGPVIGHSGKWNHHYDDERVLSGAAFIDLKQRFNQILVTRRYPCGQSSS